VTLKDGAANDGKDLRDRIKKDSKSIPLGASLRWAVNSSEGGFLQLQVKDPFMVLVPAVHQRSAGK